jgi:hypothetical protein
VLFHPETSGVLGTPTGHLTLRRDRLKEVAAGLSSILARARESSGFGRSLDTPSVLKFIMKAPCCTAKSMLARVALLSGLLSISGAKWYRL